MDVAPGTSADPPPLLFGQHTDSEPSSPHENRASPQDQPDEQSSEMDLTASSILPPQPVADQDEIMADNDTNTRPVDEDLMDTTPDSVPPPPQSSPEITRLAELPSSHPLNATTANQTGSHQNAENLTIPIPQAIIAQIGEDMDTSGETEVRETSILRTPSQANGDLPIPRPASIAPLSAMPPLSDVIPPPPRPPLDIMEDTSSEDEDDGRERMDFEEDKSGPSEEELKDIEARGEKNANDHEYWTRRFFKALDDPEYIPTAVGRIDWVVKNVRGTYTERTNHKLLRSPKVRIGDLDWNLKYFPRGNNTSQISIYLECNKPEPNAKRKKSRPQAVQDQSSKSPLMEPITPSEGQPSEAVEVQLTSPIVEATQLPVAADTVQDEGSEATEDADDENSSADSESEGRSPKRRKALDHSWGIAAQFGVVMYNPAEPRTNVYHGNHHLFCASAPDWGWTRFHGPSDTIHKRRVGQRAALLRNDTLAFTAYIRTVKDETKSLWDHSAKDGTEWNSLAKTGLRAMSGECLGRTYVVAALSAWLLLKPVRDLICQAPVPKPDRRDDLQQMPLLFELQCLLHRLQTQVRVPNNSVSVESFVRVFGLRYGLELTDKIDVIEFWEILRMKIEHELEGTGLQSKLADIFDFQATLSDDWLEAKCMPGGHRTTSGPHVQMPGLRVSVADFAHAEHISSPYLTTNGQENTKVPFFNTVPKVLHIELERFVFEDSERRWKRLDRHFELSEKIELGKSRTFTKSPRHFTLESLPQTGYSLYGFITHEGDLRSGHFNSILRPGGPGTKWYRYLSERQGSKVEALTQKKASALNGEKALASVAYIAIYVRDDVLGEILCGLPQSPNPPEWIQQVCERQDAVVQQPDLTKLLQKNVVALREKLKAKAIEGINVTVLDSDSFKGVEGPGICSFNLYKPGSRHKARPHVQVFKAGINGIVSNLQEMIAGTEWKSCQLWIIQGGRPTEVLHPNDLLLTYNNMKMWLRRLSAAETKEWISLTKIDEPLPPKPPIIRASAQSSPTPLPTATADASNQSNNTSANINTATSAVHIPSTPALSEFDAMQVEDADVDEAARTIQAIAASAEAPSDEIPPGLGAASHHTLSTMLYYIEQQTLEVPRQSSPPTRTRPAIDLPPVANSDALPPPPALDALAILDDVSATRTILSHLQVMKKHVYLLVKHYDPDTQTLKGVGSLYCKREAKIGGTLRSKFGIDKEIDMIVWEENRVGRARKLIASQNFDYANLENGDIIIWQARVSEEAERNLKAMAQAPDVADYLQNIITSNNYPTLQDGPYTTSYFGGSFFSGHLLHGREHGEGRSISATGDSYSGPFVYGHQHGHRGTMTFASGDKYTGSWDGGCMEGQGTMEYAKTGNVYTGGFKADRRHGKGTMMFLVADDEANTCQICYEAEMDAVFNDCGHLCACLGCARQVDSCPVCRKAVLSVIKLFRA
ncbi:MAG: Alsin [Vezdaea aestivalis]|nr:MAG: Alsin [Vezdaea aestivalis]